MFGKLSRRVTLGFGLAFLSLVGLCRTAVAVPAAPGAATVKQPDGTTITIVLRGDEYCHWNEDARGYAIVKSPRTGFWVYARRQGNRLTETNLKVGKSNPVAAGLNKPNPSQLLQQPSAARGPARSPQRTPTTGTMKNLVVLVAFSDKSGEYTQSQFTSLFNDIGYTTDGAVGSVKDFYKEISYNALTVNSTVTAWVTLDNGYAYYGANSGGFDVRPREMVQEALAKLEAAGFDFTTVDGDNDGWVDGLDIIHAGGGEEYGGNDSNYIWSHKWELSSTVTYDGVRMKPYHTEPARRGWDSSPSTQGITRIGVICHETGHFLGLPDLYDYGYDSEGVGDFCLMAGGSWNGDYGTTPAHMSAWCKTTLGWVTPTEITSNGTYSAAQVETNQQVYKLHGSFSSSNEYFLLENRQGTGFDAGLPGPNRGLLIWHIDENQPDNDDQTHYMVDVEEASGTQHLELNQNDGEDSDYFRSGNATQFNGSTSPDSRSYAGSDLGLEITDVGASGATMAFTIGGGSTEPVLSIQSKTIDDSAGNNNGVVDPGETISMSIVLANSGGAAATGVSAVLSTSTPGVTITQPDSAYPDIAVSGTGTNSTPYKFRVSGSVTCGTVINFTLAVTSNERNFSLPFQVPTGTTQTNTVFFDNMESGTGNWTHSASSGSDTWALVYDSNAKSPTRSWHCDDIDTVSDQRLITIPIAIPPGSNQRLRFWHTYQFENGYDGGVIEISTNGGGSYTNLESLILSGGYTRTISSNFQNPLAGQRAWSGGAIGGMTEVVVDLSPFAGQNVILRWRAGTDISLSALGWYIDDVRITQDEFICSFLPSVSISIGLSIAEKDSGTSDADFTVTLSEPSGSVATVDVTTSDGTAVAGSDYVALPATTVTFSPGETVKTVTVQVKGDTVDEADETFSANLS
ncbi:MAG: M6 family metalloprotease domain-containing protein, partial [Armatimonadetes bacterium]|nr:M6 family metalloprotease domain-containing protein [Armatimonadota bacterium]